SSGSRVSSGSTTGTSSAARPPPRPGPRSGSTRRRSAAGSPGNLAPLELERAPALLGGQPVDDAQHSTNRLLGRNRRGAAAHPCLDPAGVERDRAEAIGSQLLREIPGGHVERRLAQPVGVPSTRGLGNAPERAGEID